jgi:very-short-patch-repair endonuclease
MTNLESIFLQQLKAVGLNPPAIEYRFHPSRRWRFDFAWPDKKIAVEVEGGTFASGRHVRGKGFNGDCHKYNSAALAGWTVLRGDAIMVKSGELLAYVEVLLAGI